MSLRGFCVSFISLCVLSCFIVVGIPVRQLRGLGPVVASEGAGDQGFYPVGLFGLSARGKEVFVREGCHVCHTQVVRGPGMGDIDRGWGSRRLVARDLLGERGYPLGWFRIGPDLSNYGSGTWSSCRDGGSVSVERLSDARLYGLLFGSVSGLGEDAGSGLMPRYRHLFQRLKRGDQPQAFGVSPVFSDEGDCFIPSDDCIALVSYLRSLIREYPLGEAGPVGQVDRRLPLK